MKNDEKTTMNKEKIKEMVLFISELSEGDERFGATKLNKLLFFSDFLAFKLYGDSISGASYQAMPEGPMLKGFYGIRDEMVENDDLIVREKNYKGYSQHRPLAIRSADVKLFKPEELDIIARIINEHREMTAAEISAKSHEFPGWLAVNIEEEIPYSTALISTRDLTLEEYELPSKVKLDKKSELNLVPVAA